MNDQPPSVAFVNNAVIALSLTAIIYTLYALGVGAAHWPTDPVASGFMMLLYGVLIAAFIGALERSSGRRNVQPPVALPGVAPAPAPAPGPVVVPAPGPVPVPVQPSAPAPVPILPPVPAPVAPRNVGITATSFAGPNDSIDSRTGAYTGKLIDSHIPGVALPYHFQDSPRPKVRVFRSGKTTSVDCDIVDVGPWYPSARGPADKYWETGSRPRAESDHNTNHAGIDLTPGAWSALGSSSPTAEKALVDWDFIDARAAPVPAPAPGVGTTLVANVWPTQAEAEAFYGSPHSTSQHVEVTCPWIFSNGARSITIHQKCAASLTRILNFIWNHPVIDRSPAKIAAFGYDVFDGSYNDRVISGTNTESMHGFACAIDIDAAENPQHAPLSQCKFKADPISLIVFAFESESWIWGGRWGAGSIDAMHFQAARVR